MSGMDIRLIRAFVTVAEQGSYHKAAMALHLTQPALSKQIQALEQQVGGALFQRGRHGAILTELGQQLFSKAQDLVKQHHHFLSYTREIQKKNSDSLLIGFGISSFNTVPAWINIFQNMHTGIELSVSHNPSSVQCKLLMDGSLHVGFVRLPMTEPLSSIFIKHEKLILAVPSAKTWQQKSERDILMSNTILQINPDQSPCQAEQTRQYLLQSDITAEPASVTDDIHTLLALIAGGNGVALLPESVRNFLPAGVSLHNLEGNQAGWDIGLVWNSQISNHLRDQFIETVKNNIKSNH